MPYPHDSYGRTILIDEQPLFFRVDEEYGLVTLMLEHKACLSLTMEEWEIVLAAWQKFKAPEPGPLTEIFDCFLEGH